MAAGWRAVGGRLPTALTVSTMHPHNIAPALADARVADLQRATTRRAANRPPRRHRHLRALVMLGLVATAALAALAPTGALARPPHDIATATAPAARARDTLHNQIDTADHAAAIRSINLHRLARDVSAAPVPIVRVTRAPHADSGFDWVDGSIVAALTAMLLLGAVGLAAVRRRPTTTAR